MTIEIFYDQSQKNVASFCRDWTCDLLITSQMGIPLNQLGQLSIHAVWSGPSIFTLQIFFYTIEYTDKGVLARLDGYAG